MVGPKASCGAGEEPHDGPGHDVGAAVPQHVERFAVLVGEDLEGDAPPFGGQLAVEVDDRAVDLGGDGGLGEPLADALGDVARPGAGGDLLDRAVGELEGEHAVMVAFAAFSGEP